MTIEIIPTIPCEQCGKLIIPVYWDMEHPAIKPRWFYQCDHCTDASSFSLPLDDALAQHTATRQEHNAL
ncbi:MAG: hypothetical protein RLP44_02595 [Aggregatilineales bacterium]